MLYTAKKPFANDIVQELAWAQAFRELPSDHRDRVVPHPPEATEILRWLGLGKVLRRLHVELAADGLDFAAAQSSGLGLAEFNEKDRWQVLVELQGRYHDLLDGQKLWDIQTARLKAIEFNEVRTDREIVLVGTVDLNATLRMMLDKVAEHVTAFIVAPEELAHRFDRHGCLVPTEWTGSEIPLRDDQLFQAEGPVEQVDAVSDWLAEVAGRVRNDEVAIGVLDESLVPQLQRQLEQYGVRGRWVEGIRLGETAPFRLLAAAVQLASRRRYEDLAAVVRHPDAEDWLEKEGRDDENTLVPGSLPAQLDLLYNARLPSRIPTGESLPDKTNWPGLALGIARIDRWLADAGERRRLRFWGVVFRKVLGDVYGDRTLHLDQPADETVHRTLNRLLEECDRLGTIPEALDRSELTAADAFQVAIASLAGETLPPPADPESVEILGWLELPLDDAPALILTSCNEGFVPRSTGADAFLPDRFRRGLGLLHNERRYARDAYAMSVLCHSRKELRVVFGRRDTADDPMMPSRLVFACAEDTLVQRARRFFGESKAPVMERRLLLASRDGIPEQSVFNRPEPVRSGKPIERIPVTHFKSYLACPYRYYLRHVRKLEAVDDCSRELDGGGFGTLLHRVLGTFGRDPKGPRSSTREQDVLNYLEELLIDESGRAFGRDNRRPAIRLQLEQARQRLEAFATHQAELVRQGWRIVYAEEDHDELSVPFEVSGSPIKLLGRIDRIDVHEDTKRVRILDYKTGDKAQHPLKTHFSQDQWIDLQLPLYRHLWPAKRLNLPATSEVELGYFNVPRQLDKTGVVIAEWDVDMLETADNVARRVVTAIRNEEFWPPADVPPEYSEDFAAICLDAVLQGPSLTEDEEVSVP
jgi:RecB family exonuclease